MNHRQIKIAQTKLCYIVELHIGTLNRAKLEAH